MKSMRLSHQPSSNGTSVGFVGRPRFQWLSVASASVRSPSRLIRLFQMALLCLITLSSALPALLPTSLQAAPAAQSACEFGQFGGLILDRWRELGGANSALGCPLTPNEEIGWENKDARIRRFVNGEASFSPWAGGVVLFVWREPVGIRLQWKSTAPFNYDKWQVNWVDGGTELRDLPRSEGSFLFTGSWYRDYSFTVQGCDEPSFLGHTQCRQGWFHRVYMPASTPGLRAEVRVGDTTRVLIDNDRILGDVLDRGWGAMRVDVRDLIRQGVTSDPSLYGINLDIGERGEVRPRMENGHLVVDYIVRGNWITGKAHVDSGICGRMCNPAFRVNYTLILTMGMDVTNGSFQITNASAHITEARIDTTNLAGDIGAREEPSALRNALREISQRGNVDVTDKMNTALTPVSQALLNVPPGIVILEVNVDPRGKVLVLFGPR